MAVNRTVGTRVLNVEIDADLRDYLDEFATVRRMKKRSIVEQALRRFFKDPPPPESPEPLPPLSTPPTEKPPPAPGKRVRK